ncbi:terminase [Phyllobacterium sp. A18/5-2]|uniref:terminase small subunit n=1 Tax=Phyllobacterium sp. A18/5-2 TaxID=2978392 RepID=UPI0021C873C2|nr:terminase small subunit [Phyllobacterium sp. A18/5-2]UXN64423.1 terminase [Phyllobacterium sp. A18/5-2]
MPVLKNPRHEKFAQAVVEGKSAAEAYADAGFKPQRQNAARLMTNDDVVARVKELQAEGAERTLVSIESLTNELEEARRLAMADEKGASAAVAAVMGKAKLHGLLIEKNEHTGKGGAPIEVRSLADFYSDLNPGL